MQFLAELKETRQSKRASLDNVYSVRFETDDPSVLDLAKLPSDTLFNVSVTANGQA